MSSIAAPLPEVRSGPLQIGHTNNSSSRLSIGRSLRRLIAFFNLSENDVQQCVRLAPVEACAHRDVPMPYSGELSAFYGILLGHEHRLVVAELEVFRHQVRMVGKRTSHDFDPARPQHVEEPLRVADTG